ncbi:MAG TPA: hypothetical protein VJ019_01020 [Aestuariivirga sp.]|nr:hypothetical protein [Aestuariivirga sp.]
MKSGGVKVFHCGTDSGFERRRGRKKLSVMTAIHSSHRAESATFGILLTNIFSATSPKNVERDRNFRMQSRKMLIPSAHGAAAILPDLLKYSTESDYLSVYGRSVLRLAHLPVVREIRAIHQMLTAYCRITQSGPKETSTTITNTEDRYAQSLG